VRERAAARRRVLLLCDSRVGPQASALQARGRRVHLPGRTSRSLRARELEFFRGWRGRAEGMHLPVGAKMCHKMAVCDMSDMLEGGSKTRLTMAVMLQPTRRACGCPMLSRQPARRSEHLLRMTPRRRTSGRAAGRPGERRARQRASVRCRRARRPFALAPLWPSAWNDGWCCRGRLQRLCLRASSCTALTLPYPTLAPGLESHSRGRDTARPQPTLSLSQQPQAHQQPLAPPLGMAGIRLPRGHRGQCHRQYLAVE